MGRQSLLNGVAKCVGFTRAFYEFMKYFKISVDYVDSIKVNHAWNVVQSGSKQYQNDTTNSIAYNIYEY